jgi:lysyl endopeptidase
MASCWRIQTGLTSKIIMRRLLTPLVLVITLSATAVPRFALAQAALTRDFELEASRSEHLEVEPVNMDKVYLEDEKRVLAGHVPQYATAIPVMVKPLADQQWVEQQWSRVGDEVFRWRLGVTSPGALSLSLAFSHYQMPENGQLFVSSADGRQRLGPYTAADNKAHGQLWTPPLDGDSLVLELTVPGAELERLELELTRIHHGYAGLGGPEPRSGSCQRDVACSETSIWQDVARSVALVSIEGVRFCSGFLVNNTQLDGRPLFITAAHCGVTAENAASVVVMWNYESPLCDEEGAPDLDPVRQSQTGATLRASYAPSDFVLLELDEVPDAEWNVHYAGWDRSESEPLSAAAIHHPNTDRKRISFDYDRARTSSYLKRQRSLDGDHLQVTGWDLGTTEGGSSGSPLFNQDQRVVGQLHGGYAACSNRRADWFGRLAVSWTGGETRESRLSEWLDPLVSAAVVLDGINASDLPE